MNLFPSKAVMAAFIIGAGALLAGHLYAGPEHADHERTARSHGNDGDIAHNILSRLVRAVHHLDLDESQKEDIHALMMLTKEDLADNTKAARAGMGDLHDVLTADTLDEEALAEVARAEGDLLAERIMTAGSVAAHVLALLNDSQRAELEEMAEHHRQKLRAHHEALQAEEPEA